MLRYDRQTKPGLVALYDIRPGNGAGLFLQPRSLHGAAELQGRCSTVSQCGQRAMAADLWWSHHGFWQTGFYWLPGRPYSYKGLIQCTRYDALAALFPSADNPALQICDDHLKSAVCKITNSDLSKTQWLQGSMPIKHGGRGGANKSVFTCNSCLFGFSCKHPSPHHQNFGKEFSNMWHIGGSWICIT